MSEVDQPTDLSPWENGEGYLVATYSLEAAASSDVATSFFSKWAVFVLCDVPKNLLFCY